jgi:hypothetical protein
MVASPLRELVRARAAMRCEYCHLSEEDSYLSFQLDHVIAEVHGGPSTIDNLAWTCYYCNTFKGPNLAGWLRDEDLVVPIFRPQRHVWADHFQWNGAKLAGKTFEGRVTIQLLQINAELAIDVRQWLLEIGKTLD